MNETIKQIQIEHLRPFENFPFQIRHDEQLELLAESIAMEGIYNPLIVRPLKKDAYEIISGHRRYEACKMAGVKTIPAIIREMDKDSAIIAVIDCNMHREFILPSEKAFAYKMKLDAMNRQGKRTDLTFSQVGKKLNSYETVAKQTGESRSQIHRYIRLTNLIKPLLDMVDQGRIALSPAVELSYLSEYEQEQLVMHINFYDATPSLSQAIQMRNLSDENLLSDNAIKEIMSERKANQIEYLKMPTDSIRKFFRPNTTEKQMQNIILKALAFYNKYQQRQNNKTR